MRTVLAIGALAVVTAGAVAVLLPSEPDPVAPVQSIDLGVSSPADTPDGAAPTPAASGPADVPQAPVPAPEPAPMPTDDDDDDDGADDRVEVDDDRDEPDEPDDD